MHSLPLFIRLGDRPVILLGDGEAADAKRRLLERAGARIVGEDEQAVLAIVAIEDDDQAEAAVTRLRQRGILVNAVDRPDFCDFTVPAIVDRDPVLIAVGTGGASAGLAKALRQRLETILPASLGTLASALDAARNVTRLRWPNPTARRRALDSAFVKGGPLDPMIGHDADAVMRWLGGTTSASPTATGDVIAAASPVEDSEAPAVIEEAARLVPLILFSSDPDDLTLIAARLLGEADRVYHHPAVPDAILNRARADAQRIPTEEEPVDSGPGLSLWLEMVG